jgi:hypothetical protein
MTLVNRRVFQEGFLMLTALFAIFWAILRASVQSITIDEANTYLFFVVRSIDWVWYASSNNHVLNTLLMWIATHTLGPSSLTVRMPALLGAILYVFTCYFLCRSITNQFSLRLPLLICLIFNPLIMDFMVAARGYSLANGFLLAAIAVPVWRRVKGRPSLGTSCALASLALGLSFTANFSFAFVDFAAFLAVVMWAVALIKQGRENESVVRIAACCALPGLLVALLICGYPLAHWSKTEIWWGAHSLGDMTRSLVEASLYHPAPRFAVSGLREATNFLKPLLLPALGILCVCQLVATGLDGSWRQDASARWLGKFGAALAGIAALSVLIHWLAFRFDNFPLPQTRTGLYLVPLITLVAGVVAGAPARSVISQWMRRGITTVFICLACYFLLCLRFTYFKEWEWDADVRDVYSFVARYNHSYGVKDVGMTWWYVSSMNYYREVSQAETFPEFAPSVPEPPPGESIYVVNGFFDREFLQKEKLVVVYRGKSTDVVVAVRPDGPIPAIRIDPE